MNTFLKDGQTARSLFTSSEVVTRIAQWEIVHGHNFARRPRKNLRAWLGVFVGQGR